MKDIIFRTMFAVVAALSIAACEADIQENPVSGYGTAEVTIQVSGHEYESRTKSSFNWQDDAINDVEFVITDTDGKLVDVLYGNSPSGLSFRGKVGSRYMIWGAANIGGKIEVKNLGDFTSGSRTVSFSQIISSGIPMYSADPETGLPGPCPVTVGEGMNTVTLDMVRMMAKINFKIDRSRLAHPESFSVKSLKLYNAVNSYSPFAQNVKQTSGTGIDCSFDSASQADLDSLKNGGAVTLYAFENMQGELLPGNQDPWKKIPSQIGSSSPCCTYLELEGSYASGGETFGKVIYRMYLGNNATTNFDVKRNTIYTVTLYPTENEIDGHRGSWKIESSDYNDARKLEFSPRQVTFECLQSGSTSIVKSPSDIEYDFTYNSAEATAAGVTITRTGDSISITSTTEITEDKTVVLHIETPDGEHEDDCIVTIVPAAEPVISHVLLLTPEEQNLDDDGSVAKIRAYYYTITDGVRDSGVDVTNSATWKITDGSRYVNERSSKGQYTWKSGPGSVKIKATYNGYNAWASIFTTAPSGPVITYELDVSPSSVTVGEGESADLKATYYTLSDGVRDGGVDVTSSAAWSITSGGSYISSTSTEGRFSWKSGPGTASVKAVYNGETASATIKTTEPEPEPTPTITSIELVMAPDEIAVDESSTGTVTVYYDDASHTVITNTSCSWAITSGGSCGTINSSGIFTGLAVGTATVKVTYQGVTATDTVNVNYYDINVE